MVLDVRLPEVFRPRVSDRVASVAAPMANLTKPITIVVSRGELALLQEFDFPCSQGVLATARETARGIALQGSWQDFDMLAGWVVGQANHARRHRRPSESGLLDSIADNLEDVLAVHRR